MLKSVQKHIAKRRPVFEFCSYVLSTKWLIIKFQYHRFSVEKVVYEKLKRLVALKQVITVYTITIRLHTFF